MLELIDYARLPGFFLIVARIAGFFMLVPFFAYRTIPMMHRVGLVITLAWVMYFAVDVPLFILNGEFFILFLKELTVGLFLGLVAYIIISAVQIAGGFIDFQMGFAIANIVDPQTGVQSPIVGQYFYTFTLLFLVATNAHHLLLDGIFFSYEYIGFTDYIPIGDESFPTYAIQTFSAMFIIAFQMSIPIVGTLFLVDVALGMIARAVPQVNVFVVGLPLKILVSFLALFVSFGLFSILLTNLFELMFMSMRDLLRVMGGA
ncbi:flagellar type III secretion system protein FliR [Halalkalibacillus sediminis]|uniref:Flagellar biosynthetic protein FliR n=1 Tax=Halalkalibacillus sediminis TaxID=2018042 RepID=A0A2I0QWD8_9BACI|nr:flagellar biosynthetic protein FliR [Halalkalibacillus sediminis]PKR78635.1 flagellar type III secretion system protein FliR [Halalkalibacillus sediminis]